MKFNYKSRKGFTLIELLVVIGILAVLAAIAIPSVAGLIDRANVSADKTNANEMTNAIERFASEYELYCQDIASGVLDTSNLDSAQGRVYNVTKVKTRAGVETLEVAQGATVADDQIAIYRDTKYPANALTARAIVENYTKTSSATFEPKQSDMHFWYSPDCGVIVYAEPNTTTVELNSQIQSGVDAKGNVLGIETQWIDLTTSGNLDNFDLDLSTVSAVLEENSWRTIYKVAIAGKAQEVGWSVGDTKSLTVNGQQKTARIIGINHDGENTITFMLTSNIGNYKINNDQHNDGGWEMCDIRKTLNGSIYDSFMSNMKPYIKTVEKTTNNVGYQGTAVSTTSDKLFLLSLNEVGLCDKVQSLGWYNETYMKVIRTEGTTYEYFQTDGYNRRANVADWWYLRSPNSVTRYFFSVDIGGTLDSADDFENVIIPAFVIG